MAARLLFVAAALLMAACGGGVSILPEPFTRERADGKIPVKTELIRQQVQRELAGMPEGEAEVRRWQAIEADYHSCRLSSKKATEAAEEVFADCMANRGYVYMFPTDAEQLHNDIAFEMKKDPERWQGEVVIATVAASPITTTSAPPPDSDSGGYTKYLLGIAAIGGIAAAVGGGGGGDGGGGDSSSSVPTPPMTMTMTSPFPTRYSNITAPELGAWHMEDDNGRGWLAIVPVAITGSSFVTVGQHINIERQMVTRARWTQGLTLPTVRGSYRNGYLILRMHPQGDNNARYHYNNGSWVIFSPVAGIRTLDQLCPARWLGNYINSRTDRTGGRTFCNYAGNTSFSPNMRQIVYAAMADGFNRGVDIGESAFSFSGRYDGNNRAAGFTYDFDTFALRTDYIRLPSKQDSEVWLDTYRFGILRPINDEARFFAGVDSYRNAIFVIDTNGDNQHRFGIAAGDGYVVKYEYRTRL